MRAYRVQHSSSIYEPALTSEQMTLRRIRPLPIGEEDAQLFELDGCPQWTADIMLLMPMGWPEEMHT